MLPNHYSTNVGSLYQLTPKKFLNKPNSKSIKTKYLKLAQSRTHQKSKWSKTYNDPNCEMAKVLFQWPQLFSHMKDQSITPWILRMRPNSYLKYWKLLGDKLSAHMWDKLKLIIGHLQVEGEQQSQQGHVLDMAHGQGQHIDCVRKSRWVNRLK